MRHSLTAARAVLLAALLVTAGAAAAGAHDIPNDVTVHAFVAPAGPQLQLLVRVPMASINDIDWPLDGDGYLDLPRLDRALHDAGTQSVSDAIAVFEGASRLPRPTIAAVRLSLEGDIFDSFGHARALVTGPALPDGTRLLPTQGMLDVLFAYPIQSDRSAFSIHPQFDRLALRVTTALQFVPPGGAVRTFEYQGGDPGLIRLDPQWQQAAWQFAQLGFFHVLDASDLLLVVFCLVMPFRRRSDALQVLAAFAAAQSVTLLASAAGRMAPEGLWFGPLVTTIAAAGIVYLALETIVSVRLDRRTAVAFALGLVYGFTVALPLGKMLQFAGSHQVTSVVSFDVGVVVAELFTLALIAPALELLFTHVVEERLGLILLAAVAGHTAWHWSSDRLDVLRKFPFGWPIVDADFLLAALRWATVGVALAAAVWLFGVVRPLVAGRPRA